MTVNNEKYCVILLGMGGPDSLEDIQPFLYNIFSDREIIQLPGGAFLQKPFAKLISRLRKKNVQGNYAEIGGSSPLYKWTNIQKDHIEFIISPLVPGFEGFIGMRYFDPMIQTTVNKTVELGFTDLVILPMYPQYCRATTGSSFAEVEKAVKQYSHVRATYINDYHDNDAYIKLLHRYIKNNIRKDESLLFSAHSIPQKFVDEGDPYVDQVKKTVSLAAGDRPYHLSFQSRTGPVKWVGPDTVELATKLLTAGEKLFIVPISFVCDHIETLYEIDIELKKLVPPGLSDNIRRMPMFNDDPAFGTLLAEIILETIHDE